MTSIFKVDDAFFQIHSSHSERVIPMAHWFPLAIALLQCKGIRLEGGVQWPTDDADWWKIGESKEFSAKWRDWRDCRCLWQIHGTGILTYIWVQNEDWTQPTIDNMPQALLRLDNNTLLTEEQQLNQLSFGSWQYDFQVFKIHPRWLGDQIFALLTGENTPSGTSLVAVEGAYVGCSYLKRW